MLHLKFLKFKINFLNYFNYITFYGKQSTTCPRYIHFRTASIYLHKYIFIIPFIYINAI